MAREVVDGPAKHRLALRLPVQPRAAVVRPTGPTAAAGGHTTSRGTARAAVHHVRQYGPMHRTERARPAPGVSQRASVATADGRDADPAAGCALCLCSRNA